MGKATVRVHYPLDSGRMVLRSDRDWKKDVEAVAIGSDGTRFDFELDLAGAFSYFKPVVLRDGQDRWSQGDNFLITDADRRLSIHPYFFADPVCSPCTLRTLRSTASGQDHVVRVFYPPGYAENTTESYPVLYMHDGQNLFFPGESLSGHHWKVDETLKLLDAMNLVRRIIVVGIYPGDRQTDYTAPGYEAYGRFLVEDLKPWVDANYRTLPGADQTATMGSSLGGVVALHLAWRYPEVFGKAACLSSTFGWRDDLRQRITAGPRPKIQIYLDSGWPGDNYEPTRSMRMVLLQAGFRDRHDLMYLAYPGARHDERDWAMRAHVPLQFFFGHD